MNSYVPRERLSLSDGTTGALRVTQIPSDDPGAVVLQFESWESEADEGAECPPLHVTIPLGLLAEGGIDIDGVLGTTREKVRKQVENMKRGRARLAMIPAGKAAAQAARAELAMPDRPVPAPAAGTNTAPPPEGMQNVRDERRPPRP